MEAEGDKLRPDLWDEKGPTLLRSEEDAPENSRCRIIGGSRFLTQEFGGKLKGREGWGQDFSGGYILFAYIVCCVFLLWVAWREGLYRFLWRSKSYGSDTVQGRIWAIPSVLARSPLFSVLLQIKNILQCTSGIVMGIIFMFALIFTWKVELELLITPYSQHTSQTGR